MGGAATEGGEARLQEQAARVESLLAEMEALPDPALRATVAEIVQGLLSLYGAGLERIVETMSRGADRSPAGMLQALARDELVAHLLLLHDLHPEDLRGRVARGLEEARPYLQSHGGSVELVAVEEGLARVRLQGSCRTCPSSAAALHSTVEAAILRAAPDLIGVVVEPEAPERPGFVPASALLAPAAVGGPSA